MAKSLSPAKQLESAARIAIVLLPLGSEERIALARALNALVPKATGKPLTVKQIIRMTTRELHAKAPEICYCQNCSVKKMPITQWAWIQEHGTSTPPKIHIEKSEAPDRSEELNRLATCACGHPAAMHEQDELDNLLACNVHIEAIDQDCNCDHFRMNVQEQAAA